MTSFFHDLEEQLRAAAQQRTSGAPGDPSPRAPRPPRRRGRWGWLAGSARAVPVAAAVAVTLAVVIGALVLLGHRGGQSPVPPASGGPGNAFVALIEKTPQAQLRREFALIGAATRKVLASAACRVPQPPTPGQIHGAPGQALLSTLGVLRRSATAADRVPAGSQSTTGPGVSVYAGATRRAATIVGTSYYLVPIRQDPAGGLPPPRCFALQKAALDKALPTFPAPLRAPARELQATVIAYLANRATKTPVDALCEVTVSHNGGGMSCSDTVEQIQHGLIPDDENGTLSGLVPDGVASVTLSFPTTSGRRARSVTATVHDNVYAVDTGVSGPLKPGSPTIIWRAAGGQVLRTYSEPPQSSVKQICRQYPESCVPAVALEGASASGSSASASATATVPSRPSPHAKKRGG